MRNDVNFKHLNALKSGDYFLGIFLELDTGGIPFRVWSGEGMVKYTHNQQTPIEYTGLGALIDVSLTPDSSRLEIQETYVEISYVAPDIAEIINNSVQELQGRLGHIYIGVLGEDRQIISNLIHEETFRIQVISIEVERDGLVATLLGESGIVNLGNPSHETFSPEHHKIKLEYLVNQGFISSAYLTRGDSGFDFIPELVDTNPVWVSGQETPKFNTSVEPDFYNNGRVLESVTDHRSEEL